MRIKLDENLPHRLIPELAALGHEVDTVHAERLTGRPDEDVWEAAQSAGRFLITQDLDSLTCAATHREHMRDCYWCVSKILAGMPW